MHLLNVGSLFHGTSHLCGRTKTDLAPSEVSALSACAEAERALQLHFPRVCFSITVSLLDPAWACGAACLPDNPRGIAPTHTSYPGHPTEFCRAHGEPIQLK